MANLYTNGKHPSLVWPAWMAVTHGLFLQLCFPVIVDVHVCYRLGKAAIGFVDY